MAEAICFSIRLIHDRAEQDKPDAVAIVDALERPFELGHALVCLGRGIFDPRHAQGLVEPVAQRRDLGRPR